MSLRILRMKEESSDAKLRDETELVKAASRGDHEAFNEIVQRYEKMIYNIAYQASGNSDDAYDISQEVLIKIFRSLGSFRGDCKLSTWIYRIAMNAVKDYIRLKLKTKTASLIETDDSGDERQIDIPDTSVSANPSDSLERNERVKLVREAIASLSEDHRNIITLRDIDGYSYEDISEMLGLEIGTVKSRINRARQNIKEYLISRNIF